MEATSGGKEALHLKPYHEQSVQPESGKGEVTGALSGEAGDGDAGVDSVRRVWLEDGDEVVLRGWCRPREGGTGEAVSFGECRGILLPSLQSVIR